MDKKRVGIISVIALIVIGLIVFLLVNNNKSYEVVFDSNGGSIVETQKVKKSETAVKPNDPTMDGYKFDNWYLDDKVFDFSTPIEKNITLKAKWIKDAGSEVKIQKYAIIFNSDGGSSVSSLEVDENGLVKRPIDPTRDGYKFVDWLLNGKDYDFNTPVSGNLTLTAKWEKVNNTTNTNNDNKKPNNNKNNNNNNNNNKKDDTIEVSSIKLSKSSLSLKVGENSTLTVTINPSNATDKKVTWSSSNKSVATVDSNGKVVAVGPGTAVITAKVGNKTVTCTVTVTENVTYSVKWEEVKNSSIGQYKLYIVSSKGEKVSGVVTITVAGKSSDVSITKDGKMYIKSAVEKAVVKSVN